MFLFIFESIGTSELVLIGIVALMFLGPRKMPEYARKIGKMMNEFRSTTNEFKETWQREVNFEEEAKAFSIDELDAPTVPRSIEPSATASIDSSETEPLAPAIKSIDPAAFNAEAVAAEADPDPEVPEFDENDKKNWL